MTLPFDLGLASALWLGVAVLVAAFVRGYSGFGYSAMVIAAASLVTSPLNFVAVVMLAEVAMTAQSWRGVGAHVDWRRVRWLLIGAVVGLPLGLWALTGISENAARAVISAYVLLMCLILLVGFRFQTQVGRAGTIAAGMISGLANAPGMGGLPVAAFFAAQPMAAPAFRATLVAYFPLLDVYSAPLYFWHGLISWDTLWASLWVLPLTFLGNWLGGRRFFQTDPQDFRRFAIYLLAGLAAMGLIRAVL
jgi:uncharacterized membrane protein YfcA